MRQQTIDTLRAVAEHCDMPNLAAEYAARLPDGGRLTDVKTIVREHYLHDRDVGHVSATLTDVLATTVWAIVDAETDE